jgi:threonine/homoserine/homoserine lactone efflux protein
MIWLPVHLIWLGAGAKLGSLSLSPNTQHVINIAMGLSLVGVVLVALLAGF